MTLLLMIIALLVPELVYSRKSLLVDIFWNSSNPIFHVDNTEHVFTLRIKDRLRIHCPFHNDSTLMEDTEQMVIYKVSKFGYDNCVLDDEKVVGVCNPAYTGTVLSLTIRKFTPNPSSFDFTPGKSYYFISTSDGTEPGLDNKSGGLCKSKTMKVRLDIAPTSSEQTQQANTVDGTPKTAVFSPKFRTLPPASVEESDSDIMDPFVKKIKEERDRNIVGYDGFWKPSSAPEAPEPFIPDSNSNNRPTVYVIPPHDRDDVRQPPTNLELQKSLYWSVQSDDARLNREVPSSSMAHYETTSEFEEITLEYNGVRRIWASSRSLLSVSVFVSLSVVYRIVC